jgi:hypothetical protein
VTYLDITGAKMAETTNERNWVPIAAIVIAVISFFYTASTNHAEDTAQLKQRVTAVETKTSDIDGRLDRIERKIDRLMDRVQR